MEQITGTGKLSRAIRELQNSRGSERPVTTTSRVRVQNTTRGTIVDPAFVPKSVKRQAAPASVVRWG